MNKRSTAINASGSYTKRSQMSKKVPPADHIRTHNRDRKELQGDVTCSDQRRWSADFYKRGTSPVIIVRKNKKEPQPPQRSVSLRPHLTAPHPSHKRYSCPPIGIQTSSSSSSSSSTTSSCSSPSPVQTSVITGPDPRGWKLRPKSNSRCACTNRLSLQIPLPTIPNPPEPDPAPKTKPALKPKPPRRHSESSASLTSQETPLLVVTLAELCTVHLRRVTLSDDDVFSSGSRNEEKTSAGPHKTPPPVSEKTATARQTAQLIAHSRQGCRPLTAKNNTDDHIYSSIMKPKPKCSQQTMNQNNIRDTNTAGLHLDVSCDRVRGRSTPHFPG